MIFIRLVVAALASFPLVCSAQSPIHSASVGTGCQVAVDAAPGDSTYRWQGECKDGRAEGPGLLTSSHGGMLRGEFKKGMPHGAAGFWPLRFKGGGAVMTQMNVSNGVSMQDSIDLPIEQGRPSPTSSAPLAGEWTFTSG